MGTVKVSCDVRPVRIFLELFGGQDLLSRVMKSSSQNV